ncbi:hypothetical protein GYN07_34795 (plasmid) [Rhizobium leguminosarum bv. viciae 248]|uniref:hypothetical protein n=1 Tax=Rhizobium leguminosarum TaxID=384 RepID=UPI0003816820|nr:hypothetical protein [Rhizobium leguminosarum]MCA2406575.1 hypothetical protein [Rhizobium leguminosarum]QPZ93599.1 hypothetical protein GYN07_34795 [Rhizobium leguminosarum bv. viciae 248]
MDYRFYEELGWLQKIDARRPCEAIVTSDTGYPHIERPANSALPTCAHKGGEIIEVTGR